MENNTTSEQTWISSVNTEYFESEFAALVDWEDGSCSLEVYGEGDIMVVNLTPELKEALRSRLNGPDAA